MLLIMVVVAKLQIAPWPNPAPGVPETPRAQFPNVALAAFSATNATLGNVSGPIAP